MAQGLEWSGVVLNDLGGAVDGATVNLYDVNQTTTSRANDETDEKGEWDISHSTEGRFDLKITNGTDVVWLRARDQFQVTTIQARNPTALNAAGHFMSTVPIATETSSLVATFGFRPSQEASGVETPDVPTDNLEGYINFELSNDETSKQQWTAARLTWVGVDVSDGTEDGRLDFAVMTAGTLADELQLNGAALSPTTDGGLSLGIVTGAWSDLFLDTGAVINWQGGDITLTHTIGKLTFGGDGAVEVDFANHEMTNVDINSGAIDGTTIGAASAAAGTFTTIAGTAFSVSTAGLMFINETLNSKMTIGLTINMGANDNDIITLKSSDVNHSMTSLTETDTFGVLKKARGGSGGLFVQAYKDADEGAGDCLILMGVLGEAADTTNTSSSVAVIELDARIKSGSSSGSVAATGNVLAIMNNGVTLQLWEGDGDVHTSTVDATNSNSVAAAALDDWDDAGLIRTLTALTQKDLIRNRWDEALKYNEQSLIRAGIIGKAGLANGALLNETQLRRAMAGAIWQQSSAIRDLQEEITELRTIALGAG